MSIIKQMTLPNTLEVSYWKIISIDLNFTTKKATVALAGYKDKEMRDISPQAIFTGFGATVSIDDTSIDIRPEIYNKLKRGDYSKVGMKEDAPFFKGATNS